MTLGYPRYHPLSSGKYDGHMVAWVRRWTACRYTGISIPKPTSLQHLALTVIALSFAGLAGQSAAAAAFTSSATGAYDANATWTGGTANPANGTQDAVTLNHTVTISTAVTDAALDDFAFGVGKAGLNNISGSGGTVTNSNTSDTVLTVGGGGSYSFAGVIANGATNKLSLAKSGAGTQTLGGGNTYTGNTTVTGGTLDLATTGHLKFVIGAYGVNNGIEYSMGATGSTCTASPGIVSNTVIWTNGGNIPSSAYGTQFVVQTSNDLVSWADVAVGNLTTNTNGPGGAIPYTLPTGAGKIFARLVVTPN